LLECHVLFLLKLGCECLWRRQPEVGHDPMIVLADPVVCRGAILWLEMCECFLASCAISRSLYVQRSESNIEEVGASFEVETDSQTTSCARPIWCLHRRMELKYADRRDDCTEVIEGLGFVVIKSEACSRVGRWEEEVTKHMRANRIKIGSSIPVNLPSQSSYSINDPRYPSHHQPVPVHPERPPQTPRSPAQNSQNSRSSHPMSGLQLVNYTLAQHDLVAVVQLLQSRVRFLITELLVSASKAGIDGCN
jgi:hypothetical protein